RAQKLPFEMSSLDLFITDRREDSPGQANRFFNSLTDELGRNHVFRGVNSDAIREKLDGSNALLVVIGPHWLTPALSDGNEPVRMAIEMGLNFRMRVIPVLVAGATMPLAKGLPEILQPIVRLRALEISDKQFDEDVLEVVAQARARRVD